MHINCKLKTSKERDEIAGDNHNILSTQLKSISKSRLLKRQVHIAQEQLGMKEGSRTMRKYQVDFAD